MLLQWCSASFLLLFFLIVWKLDIVKVTKTGFGKAPCQTVDMLSRPQQPLLLPLHGPGSALHSGLPAISYIFDL